MRKIQEVLRLTFALGLTRRQVADALHLAPSTVSDYVKRAEVAGVAWPLPENLDTAALESTLFRQPERPVGQHPVPDWNYIRRELTKTGVTKWLLWEEYREQHLDGYAYSQFCNLYREWSKTVDVVMRQEHRAGEKLFVDYAGPTIPIYDPLSGEVMLRAQLFVAALGASSYVYAEATATQDLTDFVTAHVHAFEYMGGAAKILVPDNLKSGVTKPNRYEAELTRTYEEMAAHYGVAVIPARAYRPRDKAKVEAAVLLCERWIMAKLRHERFSSLAQLNHRIAELLEAINAKPFKKLDGSRRTLFETIDGPALTPLPPTAYILGRWKQVTCNIDYHVDVDRHYYSVPYQLVGKRLDVRASAHTVEVFFKGKRVASHLRSTRRGGFTTTPAHMPESHRRHAEWTPGRMIAWAEKTGPATAAFASKVIELRPHPEHGYRSILGVIRLGKHYEPERIEAACRRAIALGSFSYTSVKSILEHGLDRQPLPQENSQPHRRHRHRNVRGGDYYS
ncbi:MAG: IS21 family transposase [Acidimicrobiales bacterium]